MLYKSPTVMGGWDNNTLSWYVGNLVVVVVLIGEGGSDFHSESTIQIILIKSQSDHIVVRSYGSPIIWQSDHVAVRSYGSPRYVSHCRSGSLCRAVYRCTGSYSFHFCPAKEDCDVPAPVPNLCLDLRVEF